MSETTKTEPVTKPKRVRKVKAAEGESLASQLAASVTAMAQTATGRSATGDNRTAAKPRAARPRSAAPAAPAAKPKTSKERMGESGYRVKFGTSDAIICAAVQEWIK